MKVEELKANGYNVELLLTPEHPAEIALVNLLNGCEAACNTVEPKIPPEANAAVPQMPPMPQLQIVATVKKTRY